MINKRIIFLGAPGVGKGTIAKLLKDKLCIPHISTGDIFRAEIKAQTELGKQVVELTSAGNYVPDEITNKVVENALNKPEAANGYMLDGYPRTLPQANFLKDNYTTDAVILLIAPEELIVKRLSGRRSCPKCKKGYHTEFMKPKKEGVCDVDGATLEQRKDDMPEAIKHRLDVYNQETLPLIKFYKKEGSLYEFDSSTNPDKICASIMEKLFND